MEITKEMIELIKMVMYSETTKLFSDEDCVLMIEEAARLWEFKK